MIAAQGVIPFSVFLAVVFALLAALWLFVPRDDDQ